MEGSQAGEGEGCYGGAPLHERGEINESSALALSV